MPTKVYIDQGHNPKSPNAGAEGNGYREQDLVYEIGVRLYALFESNPDYEARLSRKTPEEILGSSNAESLRIRVQEANAWGADIFLSLHTNASVDASASGCEGLVFSAGSGAYRLAERVTNSLARTTGLRNRGVLLRPGLYVLRRTAMPKKMKYGVLICGAYGKGNAGDDAILKAILAQMKAIDRDMPVYVMSHDPAETRLRYHVGSVHVFDPFRFWPLMRRCRLFISGGGSLIQNETSTRSLNYYLTTIRMAHTAGCRVMMYGCGIGPVSGEGSRRHTARILNRCVDKITLREDLSRKELSDMGVMQPDISVTADPALLLQPATTGAVDSYFLSNDLDPNGSYAMFVLRPWKNLSRHLQAIVDAAIYVNQKHGLTPVFVALEPTRDLEINRQAAGMLSCRSFVLPAPRDEQLTIGMMQKMRVIVSMRLHALIFASSVGAPLAAISYDPKVTGFMAYLGQKHCMELDDVTKDSLCALIDDAMQTAQPYSTDRLRRLAAENEEAARKLLEETI